MSSPAVFSKTRNEELFSGISELSAEEIAVRNEHRNNYRFSRQTAGQRAFAWSLVCGLAVLMSTDALLPARAQGRAVANEPREEDASLPYEAVVKDRTINVYSGPGDVHYVTDRLPVGARVEVYRHDPDGWLAVRPPRGSFSLVPADSLVQTDEPGIARVAYGEVKAWVGTRLRSPTRPLWQVRLRQGELVEVVGEQPTASDQPADIRWLRIAPPAGEFRWVQASEVTRFHPSDVSSHEGPSSASPPEHLTRSSLPRESSEQAFSAKPAAPAASQSGSDSPAIALLSGEAQTLEGENAARPQPLRDVDEHAEPLASRRQTESPAADKEASGDNEATRASQDVEQQEGTPASAPWPDDFVRRPDGPNRRRLASDAASESNGSASIHDPSLPPKANSIAGQAGRHTSTPAAWSDHIRQLEIQLTRMATLPVEQWQTSAIRRLAQQLSSEPPDSAAAARLEALLKKLDRFDELKVRRLALQDLLRNSPTVGTGVPPENPVLDQALDLSDPLKAEEARQALETYEGTGYLNRLFTEGGVGRGGYVLQDEQGRILQLVAPAPGVNLERYLSKHVALQGETTSHPRHERPLIIASRVILMDRHVK